MRQVALALAITVAACQPSPPQVRAFASDTSVIVDAHAATTVCMHTPEHDARWTPTTADVALLDPVLIELIEYRLDEDSLTYDDSVGVQPERYHRNYYGLEQNGVRYILVCGRYDAPPVNMRDGGSGQFGAIFDTQRRKFTWFEFGYRA